MFANTTAGRIHYCVEGKGQPLLLLHSNGGSWHQYEKVMPLVSDRFCVYSWDMPGHGDSDPLHRHTSVERYAEIAFQWMDAVGLQSAFVAGVSVGGSIGIAMAASDPSRVRGLGIVETPVRSEDSWSKLWPQIEANFSLPIQAPDEIRRRVRGCDASLEQRWNVDRCKAGARTMMDVIWALREYDVLSDLQRVTAHTLLLYGENSPVEDSIVPIVERLPRAKLEVMKGCGHHPMLDDADLFARHLNALNQ